MSTLRLDEAGKKILHVRVHQHGWRRSNAQLLWRTEFMRYVWHG